MLVHARLFIITIVVLGSFGCDGSPAASGGLCEGSCQRNSDCAAGAACIAGQCRLLCVGQADCNPCDDHICFDGLCVVGTGDGRPFIQAVAGNDPADPSRIFDGMVVTGLRLDGAGFELQDNTATAVAGLQVRSQAATVAELVFPADIESGTYTLFATNSAGSADAEVTLTLPELTGDILIERINGATTGVISTNVLPVGTGAGTVAAGDHAHDVPPDLSILGNLGIGTTVGTAKLTINGTQLNPVPLSGTVSVLPADLTTLHGDADTLFATELRVGDVFTVAGVDYTVSVISDDQTLTFTPAAAAGFTSLQAFLPSGDLVRIENPAGATQLLINRWGNLELCSAPDDQGALAKLCTADGSRCTRLVLQEGDDFAVPGVVTADTCNGDNVARYTCPPGITKTCHDRWRGVDSNYYDQDLTCWGNQLGFETERW